MQVGCFQCVCMPGDLQANVATVMEGLEQAVASGVEILAFPECLLTGYYANEADARRVALRKDGPEIRKLLDDTRHFDIAWMVGFHELRDDGIYDTVLVAEKGEPKGFYSKAFPVYPYLKPGREFPIFERKGLKFGVIICADGAFVEPARILALKGARLIFAPHYNYLKKEWVVIHHYMVRHDHVARAIENGVWFMRANNVEGPHEAEASGFADGVGYGDSYLLDPLGQIVAHAGLHCQRLMIGTIDLDRNFHVAHAAASRASALALGEQMLDAARQA